MPYCRNCVCQLQEADNFCETCGTARREASPKRTYTGKTCPFCQFPLKADSDVTICSACGIPHHRECWAENGGCTTFGCRGLTKETEIQPGTMQPTTITEAGQAADEMLEVSFDEPSGREFAPTRGGGINKLLVAALVINLLVFTGVVFAYINLLSDRSAALPGDDADVPPQTDAPAVIATLDSDYYIDYENGTISIGDLPIGARVVDPSWVWEFRTGNNYSGSGAVKPVTWIVVAKDHYSGLEPHVTLLAEELIGLFAFDNSTKRGDAYTDGSYHWGDSGTANATRGLRPWLNSSGIHAAEGFYQAFSKSFKNAVLTTNVPNKELQNGNTYNTQDRVFLPSTTELGDEAHSYTHQIGTVYPYFKGADVSIRAARIGGETWWCWYWTRSPDSNYGSRVLYVSYAGGFDYFPGSANASYYGVRPALNLKSEILVSEIKN